MNQWLADLFLSLPTGLTDPLSLGSICLGLSWLGYLFFARAPLDRAVRGRGGDVLVHYPWQRIFYGVARKKAHLDEGGLYLIHLITLLTLMETTAIHALLVWLARDAAVVADKVLLTALFSALALLCLATQPATTRERWLRWGFRPITALVWAVLGEVVIAAVWLFWLYGAWFFPLLGQ